VAAVLSELRVRLVLLVRALADQFAHALADRFQAAIGQGLDVTPDGTRAVATYGAFYRLRRSALDPAAWGDGEVLLLDTLGELAQVYALASVVFVGGSLVPAGGHNILEPAVAGKAVVVGPYMENFQEIADQFRSESAMVQVGSPDELAREVSALLLDEGRRRGLGERARDLVGRNRGAVSRTTGALSSLLA